MMNIKYYTTESFSAKNEIGGMWPPDGTVFRKFAKGRANAREKLSLLQQHHKKKCVTFCANMQLLFMAIKFCLACD